jgi:ABC-type antimicrobial peptide transport system permease subunit
MQEALDENTAEIRVRTLWTVGLSGLALVLAATGLLASTSYWVTQCSRELAMRQALGAGRSRIAALVVGRTLRVAGVGLLLGLAGAAAGSRLLRALLHGVDPLDAASFAAAAAAVLAAALVSAGIPALAAVRVELSAALRHE